MLEDMSNERSDQRRRFAPPPRGRDMLERVRAELAVLEQELEELEQRPRADNGADAGDYLGYERQFREIERRRESFAALLSDAENARRDAAWAALVSEIELAWRELLPRLDHIRAHRR